MLYDFYNPFQADQNTSRILPRKTTLILRPHWLYSLQLGGWQALCILVLLAIGGLEWPHRGTLAPSLLWLACAWTLLLACQIGSIYASLYKITPEQIKYYSGIFGRRCENIELYRVKDISWRTSILGRILGVGNVILRTTDFSHPTFVIPGVRDPETIMQEIRERVEINRLTKHTYEISNR